MQEPITIEDYYRSRIIWDPMRMFDMDVPVDCAEALVLTTANGPGILAPCRFMFTQCRWVARGSASITRTRWVGRKNSMWVAMRGALARSDLTAADMDLFFPYDGYTPDAVAMTEAAGFCGPGEAGDFFKANWDPSATFCT